MRIFLILFLTFLISCNSEKLTTIEIYCDYHVSCEQSPVVDNFEECYELSYSSFNANIKKNSELDFMLNEIENGIEWNLCMEDYTCETWYEKIEECKNFNR
jgi:hypothetical protein